MFVKTLILKFGLVLLLVFQAGCGSNSQPTDSANSSDKSLTNRAHPPLRPRNYSSANYRSKWAVIIGINKYNVERNGLSELRSPVNDAQKLARVLRDEFGFVTVNQNGQTVGNNILLLQDQFATKESIEQAFTEWLPGKHDHLPGKKLLSNEDAVLVFFAGHGVEETSGSFLAFDSHKDKLKTCIQLSWIRDRLNELQCHHKAIILDSCYSGSLLIDTDVQLQNSRPHREKDNIKQNLSIDHNRAFWGLSSTQTNKLADDDSDFMDALFKELEERCNSDLPGEYFTFRDLASRIQLDLLKKQTGTSQKPSLGRLLEKDNHLGDGEFYFTPTIDRVTPREKSSFYSKANKTAQYANNLIRVGHLMDNDPGFSLELLENPILHDTQLREFAWKLLRNRCNPVEWHFKGAKFPIHTLSFNEKQNQLFYCDFRGTVKIAEFKNSQWKIKPVSINSSNVTESVFSCDVSPNGNVIVLGTGDGKILIWEKSNQDYFLRNTIFGHSGMVTKIILSNNGEWLASGGSDAYVRLWDFQKGQLLHEWLEASSAITALSVSQDDSRIAVGSYDRQVSIWDTKSYKLIRKLPRFSDLIESLFLHNDGKNVSVFAGDAISLWNIENGEQIRSIPTRATHFSLFTDATKYFISLWDGRLEQREASTGDLLRSFYNFLKAPMLAMSISEDNRFLARSDSENNIHIVDLESNNNNLKADTLKKLASPINLMDSSNSLIAISCLDYSVRLLDSESLEQVNIINLPDLITSLKISTNGKILAVGCADKRLRLFSLSHSPSLLINHLCQSSPTCISFAVQDKKLLVANELGSFNVINCDDGSIDKNHKMEFPILSIQVQSGGEAIIGTESGKLQRFDWKSSKLRFQTLYSSKTPILNINLAQSSEKQIFIRLDGKVFLHDLSDGLPGHLTQFNGIAVDAAISPSERTIASVSDKGSIQLQDAVSGNILADLPSEANSLSCVCFSRDGKELIAAGRYKHEGIIEKWVIDPHPVPK